MSPQLKSVEKIGIENLKRKSQPYLITESDFFTDKEILRKRFAQLIEVDDPQQIAIIPSVSFGIGIAMKNISFEKGDEIVVLEEQFPSNYYTWKQLEMEKGVNIITIKAPELQKGRGQRWNKQIAEAISSKTKCVAIPHIHWADGTKFDLLAIRERTNDVGAYLIIDGTQSVGALPFSVREIKPDALVCGGYKWLLGAYGLGVAYFGSKFDNGVPLDNNWMNHEGAENFSNLVNYNLHYKRNAARYDIGGASNFIMVPMLYEGINQLLDWTPLRIQNYCKNITANSIDSLKERGYFIEESADRSNHLFGIYLPPGTDIQAIQDRIIKTKIYVSFRGNAIRISPNVYNTKDEIEKLISCFI